MSSNWIKSSLDTTNGPIPLVKIQLSINDTINEIKARLGINRMAYKIEAGLYGVGKPNSNSPVLVTANYKLSFDKLRKELSDIDAWILVLDTKGINVWCAAGKGSFGSKELIKQIKVTQLDNLIAHKKIILPQLGAPGIAAHEIKKATGFKVVYGPIKASDLPTFLANDYQAEEKMRQVSFTLSERAVLIPIELKAALKPMLIIFLIIAGIDFLQTLTLTTNSIYDYLPIFGAFMIGIVIFPLLLPYLPTRSFAFKGWFIGLLWAVLIINLYNINLLATISYLLLLPPISSFLALNFTGCTTYTSLSGVVKEMKWALPLIIISLSLGIILRLITIF